MSDNDKENWWTKIFIRLIVPGVIVIVVAIVTPVGEWIREIIFPTSAVIEGSVQKGNKLVSEVKVTLDDKIYTTTTDSGKFIFQKVTKGVHSFKVLDKGGQVLYVDKFHIIRGLRRKNWILSSWTPCLWQKDRKSPKGKHLTLLL